MLQQSPPPLGKVREVDMHGASAHVSSEAGDGDSEPIRIISTGATEALGEAIALAHRPVGVGAIRDVDTLHHDGGVPRDHA